MVEETTPNVESATPPEPKAETKTELEKAEELLEGKTESKSDDEDELDIQQPDLLTISEDDPNYAMFKQIMERFNAAGGEEQTADAPIGDKGEVFFNDDDEIPDEDEEADKEEKLSKKKRKQQNKLSVAELKALVKKPELVDWTDTSASDPRLLVHIKS